MPSPSPAEPTESGAPRFVGWAPSVQWLVLLAASAIAAGLLRALHLPAALFLGPLIAAIALAALGATVSVPAWIFLFSQAVIGCMIARGFTRTLMGGIAHRWLSFAILTLAVLAASSLLGFLLARWRILPGTTAVWGLSPGAATAMVVMAEEYGADARLVAFMQYLRVVLVAAIASAVGALFGYGGQGAPPAPDFVGSINWPHFGETVLMATAGAVVGRRLRIPAGALLVPLVVVGALNVGGLVTVELPRWFLAICYAAVGWTVGLRFTPEILHYALRAFPRILLSILVLIGTCGLFAWVLTKLGTDPLTAYLATSPGGADSAAIIAASSPGTDLPFVMSMQIVRALSVLFFGPALARWVAGHAAPDAKDSGAGGDGTLGR